MYGADSGHAPTFTVPRYVHHDAPELNYEALLDVARGECLDIEETAA